MQLQEIANVHILSLSCSFGLFDLNYSDFIGGQCFGRCFCVLQ